MQRTSALQLNIQAALRLARRHAAPFLCVVWTLAILLAQATSLGDYLEGSITRPFYFKIRAMLHLDPELHPQLKILSYDDSSVDRLQRPDLTIDDWATVLTAVAAQKPRVILIDKIFAIMFDPMGKQEDAIKRLAAIDVPIYVGAFAIQDKNKLRYPLDTSRPMYAAQGGLRLTRNAFDHWHVYGPTPALASIFAGSGHLLYSDNGLATAALQPSPDVVIPHMSLLSGKREIKDGALYLNDRRLPLNERAEIIINFSNPDRYYDRHTRLGSALTDARAGKPIGPIKAGDTVLILPEMYTGSTDFKATPLGIMPGGFIHAAMINSVLSDRWLSWLPWTPLQIVLFAVFGMLIGRTSLIGRASRSFQFWAETLGTVLCCVVGGVYLFAAQDLVFSLLPPVAGFLGTAIIVFAERTQNRERETQRMRSELDEAAEIAKAFRPDDPPAWNRYKVAAFHKSYTEASGDWYAFRESPSGRLQHFILCDITGHGVQAALMVSICKTMLDVVTRDRPGDLESPTFLTTFARDLNAMLYHHGKGLHLVTMLGMTFDTDKRVMHYASAGHPPPLIYSLNNQGERKFSHLVSRGTVLGLTEFMNLKLLTRELDSGDEIIAYTDGLPVGRHVRAANAFFAQRQYTFEDGPKALFDAVWRQEMAKSGRALEDDVSIVWFKAS